MDEGSEQTSGLRRTGGQAHRRTRAPSGQAARQAGGRTGERADGGGQWADGRIGRQADEGGQSRRTSERGRAMGGRERAGARTGGRGWADGWTG